MTKNYYPVFLNVTGRLCIVEGGGNVAERKIRKLIQAGARVRVVSPEVRPQVQRWALEGRIEWVRRPYKKGDVRDALLVFAATNNSDVNRLISAESEESGILVNVSDARDLCSFTVPAIVHSGVVQIAISTSGTNPSVARKLREILEADLMGGTNGFQRELMQFSQLDEC